VLGGFNMKKNIGCSLFVLVFLLFGSISFAFDLFAIQSAHSNNIVRAGVGKETLLAAVSDHIQAWEKFRLIELDGGLVAIQSAHNNKIVRAGVGKESLLAAVSDHIQAWEKFRLIELDGSLVAIQSAHNNKIVELG
jgi:hypothetical protein